MRFASLALALCLASPAFAQTAPAGGTPPARSPEDGMAMMTVFLKHDQSKNLNEINETLFRQGYYDKFPPAGVEVVSWYVVMGIGQVVTLRYPADKLREINVALENGAWGPYRTEFFPTYEYKARAEEQRRMMQARPKP